MKHIILLLIGTNLVCASLLSARNPITSDIEDIIAQGRNSRAFETRLELSFISRAIDMNRPIKAETVECDYTAKVCLNQEQSIKLIREFVDVVKKADLKETNDESEWRLALIIRGAWGQRYLAAYTDQHNKVIIINGKSYLLDKDVASWIDKRLWAIEEAVRGKLRSEPKED